MSHERLLSSLDPKKPNNFEGENICFLYNRHMSSAGTPCDINAYMCSMFLITGAKLSHGFTANKFILR